MFVFLLFSAQLCLSICQMFLAVFFFSILYIRITEATIVFVFVGIYPVLLFILLFCFCLSCVLTFVWGYGVVCVYIFIVLLVFSVIVQ